MYGPLSSALPVRSVPVDAGCDDVTAVGADLGRHQWSSTKPIIFGNEVKHYFQFLVDDYGMADPRYDDIHIPVVRNERPGCRFSSAMTRTPW